MVLLQPPSSPNRKPLYARSGWEIPCETEDPFEPAILQIQNQEFERWMTYLTLRTRTPHFYNCVGMIFASRRAWIEIDHIYDILREDNFKHITKMECRLGDVVVYRNEDAPQHVGLIIGIERIGETVSLRVISKWGKDAEFEHFAEDVPESYGKISEFYTDRK